MNFGKQLKEGLITQNPVLVQVLGMCSTMAITTSFFNGLGMGVSVLIILTLSNIFISLLRKIIPNEVRIACFIVVIAGFVTCVDLLLQAFVPSIAASLGVFIPLIVVNCIILGRAEAYASKNPPLPSLFDGIGMGLGFTSGLTIIGTIREVLDYPGNAVYVVRGEHEYMIPAVKQFILSTDMENNTMQVRLIEGMRSDEN